MSQEIRTAAMCMESKEFLFKGATFFIFYAASKDKVMVDSYGVGLLLIGLSTTYTVVTP
jgi:hypothetical protein